MTSTSRRLVRAVLATVVLGAITAGAAGCTIFPTVPDGAQRALDDLLADVRAEPGVAAADGDLTDGYGTPAWVASVRVRAASDDVRLAARVRRLTDVRIPGSRLTVSLALPAGAGTAEASVDPTVPRVVTAADHLRREPDVDQVLGTRRGVRVVLRSAPVWSTVVPRVRSLAGGVPVTLDSVGDGAAVEFDVEVDRSRPGPPLLGALDTIRPRVVRYATSSVVRDGKPDGPPTLTITVVDVDSAARTLTRTDDDAAAQDPDARTTFRVFDHGAEPVVGWLGLPLTGSDPLTAPLPWVRADVSDDESAVRSFLESSARASGVPARVATAVERCSSASDVRPERWTGTRATASVLVPVFQQYDDPQEPFDRVTTAWTADGLRTGGSAMGLDSWSAGPQTTRGVESATIRGTADGLRLTAAAPCRG